MIDIYDNHTSYLHQFIEFAQRWCTNLDEIPNYFQKHQQMDRRMKNLLLLILAFLPLLSKAQNKPAIYLFTSDKITNDNCLCSDTYGFFFFVDQTNNVYWVKRNFCSITDTYQVPDTFKTSGIEYVQWRTVYASHPVEELFKLVKRNGNVYLNLFDTSKKKFDTTLYFKLNGSSTEIKRSIFHKRGALSEIFTSQMVKDTIITFNSKKISCYKVVEISNNGQGIAENDVYVSKIDLIPVYIVFSSYSRFNLLPEESPYITLKKMSLLGIMEINRAMLPKFKILEY